VDIFLYCVIIVGPLEEGVKFLIARAIVFRWRHFDEPIDGMVYASFVAIGFAAAENFLYMPYLIWQEQLVRAVTSPLTHSLFASVWGFGTAYAILRCHGRGSRFFWQAAPLGISMLLHGLYNFFLLAMHAAYIASIIILVLWIGLIWYARRLIKTEKTQA
jgi:RsiW-degrading membrane proteinase PrsW (M82 family)